MLGSRPAPRAPHVSDHALRRYIERVRGLCVAGDDVMVLRELRRHGVDVDAARRAVEAIVASAVSCGAASIKSGGARFVLRGATVVTVIDLDGAAAGAGINRRAWKK